MAQRTGGVHAGGAGWSGGSESGKPIEGFAGSADRLRCAGGGIQKVRCCRETGQTFGSAGTSWGLWDRLCAAVSKGVHKRAQRLQLDGRNRPESLPPEQKRRVLMSFRSGWLSEVYRGWSDSYGARIFIIDMAVTQKRGNFRKFSAAFCSNAKRLRPVLAARGTA